MYVLPCLLYYGISQVGSIYAGRLYLCGGKQEDSQQHTLHLTMHDAPSSPHLNVNTSVPPTRGAAAGSISHYVWQATPIVLQAPASASQAEASYNYECGLWWLTDAQVMLWATTKEAEGEEGSRGVLVAMLQVQGIDDSISVHLVWQARWKERNRHTWGIGAVVRHKRHHTRLGRLRLGSGHGEGKEEGIRPSSYWSVYRFVHEPGTPDLEHTPGPGSRRSGHARVPVPESQTLRGESGVTAVSIQLVNTAVNYGAEEDTAVMQEFHAAFVQCPGLSWVPVIQAAAGAAGQDHAPMGYITLPSGVLRSIHCPSGKMVNQLLALALSYTVFMAVSCGGCAEHRDFRRTEGVAYAAAVFNATATLC